MAGGGQSSQGNNILETGMDKSFEQLYIGAQDKHWWLRSRRKAILDIIKHYDRGSRIIDIGCSGGALLLDFKKIGFRDVTGVDNSAEAISFCKNKGLRSVYQLDGTKLNFRDNSFDIVIASDVLEHLEDDGCALKEWHRLLAPGGLAIIFVPAFRFLWSRHDEMNHHYRRYTRITLRDKLINTGFTIEDNGYWNFFLFPPLYLIRLANRFFNIGFGAGLSSLDSAAGKAFNSMLGVLLSVENYIISMGIKFPFGSSVYAVARKSVNNG